MDRTLYALVFGESVLNDAVSIVLYHALVLFQAQPVTGGLVLKNAMFFFRCVQQGAVCSVFCCVLRALCTCYRGGGPGCVVSPPPMRDGQWRDCLHFVAVTGKVWQLGSRSHTHLRSGLACWRLRLRLRVCAHNGSRPAVPSLARC